MEIRRGIKENQLKIIEVARYLVRIREIERKKENREKSREIEKNGHFQKLTMI